MQVSQAGPVRHGIFRAASPASLPVSLRSLSSLPGRVRISALGAPANPGDAQVLFRSTEPKIGPKRIC